MALYIKANPLVAKHLKLEKVRLKLRDGNYILWQADMLAFGKLYEIVTIICPQIGALPLQPWEARQEQDGTVLRQLPVAADERFIMPEVTETTESEESAEVSDQSVNPEEESEVTDEQ